MKKFVSFVRQRYHSIAFQVLCITILLILFPVIFVSIFSYSQYTKNLEQKSADSTYQTIVQLSYSLNSYLSGLFQFSKTIYYDNDLMNALNNQNTQSAYTKYENDWTIEEQLEEMLIKTRSDILSACILSNGVVYRGGLYDASISNDNFSTFDWYQKALESKDPFYVPTHTENYLTKPDYEVFSIVSHINSIQESGKILGVLKIDVEYSEIKSICDKIQIGAAGGLLIEDSNASVIYSSIQNKDYSEILNIVKTDNNPYFVAEMDHQKYIFSSTEVPSANWTIISVNSVNELNQSAARTRNITFFIALISSAVAIFILLLFTGSFLRPLLQIVHLMKQVQHGELNVYFPEKRKDEIGYLGSSFNKMVFRINRMIEENTDLVKEVYESRLLQNEAQINALYSQIKPHFLFNTLNMISLLIRCGKSDVAVDNIDKLSDLLRCMIHFNQEITIQEEISLLDAYLSIQRTRYQDRLDYSIEIDPSLNSFRVPALILQPIVENAIIHGCEKKREKMLIRIYSAFEPDGFAILVEDNANGMDLQTLEKLRERISSESDEQAQPKGAAKGGNGVGLRNVNKRIKLKFGNAYGLQIDSTENAGTCVRVVFPKP